VREGLLRHTALPLLSLAHGRLHSRHAEGISCYVLYIVIVQTGLPDVHEHLPSCRHLRSSRSRRFISCDRGLTHLVKRVGVLSLETTGNCRACRLTPSGCIGFELTMSAPTVTGAWIVRRQTLPRPPRRPGFASHVQEVHTGPDGKRISNGSSPSLKAKRHCDRQLSTV
jgi:hypothetical protein